MSDKYTRLKIATSKIGKRGEFVVKNGMDAIVAGILFLGSVYLWFVANQFPSFEKYANVDSDFWPKTVLVIIALASLPVLYQSTRALLSSRNSNEGQAVADIPKEKLNVKRIILMAIVTITYLLGFRIIGFMLATIIFLFISIWLLGIRKKKVLVLFPLLFTASITLLFVKLLSLSLPRGVSIFREISLFFY